MSLRFIKKSLEHSGFYLDFIEGLIMSIYEKKEAIDKDNLKVHPCDLKLVLKELEIV